jgi:hypothetical protein
MGNRSALYSIGRSTERRHVLTSAAECARASDGAT